MKIYNRKKIKRTASQSQSTAVQSQKNATASRSQINAEQTRKNAEKILRGSAILDKRPKYYVLDMFPYPSGDGLHMGHTESYTASDIIYRYKKLQGYDVLHRQGFDAFGLPAENYAIKTGIHPKKTTEKNIKNYLKQMKMLGLDYDYNHIVKTSDPSYYKWTQWLFGKFFENGLVERKTDKINWCPSCQTVIANEQVVDGRCERCKTKIQQKEVKGWFFKITKFAEDLIKDLDKVDWPEATKKNQRNWIGKSEGALLKFEVRNLNFDSNSNEKTLNNNKINVVLVHGCPNDKEKSMSVKTRTYNKHWQPWIKKELEKQGIKVNFPLMPHPWEPVYEDHKKEFKKLNINENSILIGYSCGASFLVRWLSETGQKIKKLILVAPWNEPDHKNKIKAEFYNISKVDYSFNKNINDGIIIFTSNNENNIGKRTAKIWKEKLNAKVIELKNHGHYTERRMGTVEFPELLNEIRQEFASVLRDSATSVEVFTTRPDTLFGATYLVLAPEHNILKQVQDNNVLDIKNIDEVKAYIEQTKNKTEMERLESKEKTGVKLEGLIAINPANGEEIPIFVADYVLSGYGTGAIMAVPAHDERDYKFAKKFDLPIKEVVIEDMSTAMNNLERKDGVLGLIKNKNGKILLQHNNFYNKNRLPGGGKDRKESRIETLKREIIEETGYTDFEINKYIGSVWTTFKVPGKPYNRKRIVSIYEVKLLSNNRKKQHLEETEDLKHYWVSKQDLLAKLQKNPEMGEAKIVERYFKKKFCYTGPGVLINSGQFDGMDSEEAKKAITEFVGGRITTNYRLRDWSISRQRYWGCPIPIVYSPEGKAKFVGEENLPWLLPEDVDFRPTGTAPLAKSKELKERTEKIFGKGWTPEVDTMDTFVDSSWYFLRYPDPENEKEFCSSEKLKKWLPVDLYIGGAEHTYMHLLYARFFVKAMYKIGLLDFSAKGEPTSGWDEPFLKLRHQGMVLDKNGVKMSKSKGNIVNPDDMVKKFGADATRMYVMFAAPLDEDVIWNEEGVKGVYRFLEKVSSFFDTAFGSREITQNTASQSQIIAERTPAFAGQAQKDVERNKKLLSLLHKTIKGVTEDIEELKFNTAISKLMIFINTATASQSQNYAEQAQNNAENAKMEATGKGMTSGSAEEIMEKFLILLSPFAPFLAEKLWQQLGHQDSIFNQQWPKYDPNLIKDELITMVIQINGKVRDNVKVPADITEKEARELALSREKIKKWTAGQEIKKAIFVKGKLVNVVI